ncbi:MAG TPA: hypothetical protein P5169_03480 [Kiritimatiellia bacterium]|nr:hypothetical protein [Kiritimatiellia bacterium]
MRMMLKIAVVTAALATAGCAMIEGTRSPDGSLTVSSRRFLWSSEGISFGLRDTNGFQTTLAVQKSSTDATAINAVFSGLQALGVSAAKP